MPANSGSTLKVRGAKIPETDSWPGDIVLAAPAGQLDTVGKLNATLATTRRADSLSLTVLRDGRTMEIRQAAIRN